MGSVGCILPHSMTPGSSGRGGPGEGRWLPEDCTSPFPSDDIFPQGPEGPPGPTGQAGEPVSIRDPWAPCLAQGRMSGFTRPQSSDAGGMLFAGRPRTDWPSRLPRPPGTPGKNVTVPLHPCLPLPHLPPCAFLLPSFPARAPVYLSLSVCRCAYVCPGLMPCPPSGCSWN